MKDKPIIVIGSGGHAKVLIDILLEQRANIIGIVDVDEHKKGQKILGVTILGDDSYVRRFSVNDVCLVNGIGSVDSTQLRQRIYHVFKEAGYVFRKVIHSSAIISSHVQLGEGVQVMAGAVINVDTTIGVNTIINTRCSIDHDCLIGNHVHIAPGSVLSGGVTVGDCTHLGTGCNVIQGINIGRQVLAGAGSMIIHHINPEMKVLGVPAKEVI